MAARDNATLYHGWDEVAPAAWEAARALGRRLRQPPDLSWLRWAAGAAAYVFTLFMLAVAFHLNPRVGFWTLYYLVGLAGLLAGADHSGDPRTYPLAWVWALVGGYVQTVAAGSHEAGAWALAGFWLAIAGTLWPVPLSSVVEGMHAIGIWAASGFAFLVASSALANAGLAVLTARIPHARPEHTLLPRTAGVAATMLAAFAAWHVLRAVRRLFAHVDGR